MPPKALVAHYDPRSRQRIRECLERWGLQVLEAADGPSAVEQARQARPDLILLYAPLPRLNAPEACQQIRQWPGLEATPVVIFSDVYRGVQVRNVLLRRFGVTDLIEWPMAEDALRQKVQAWLSGSAPPTVAVARPAEEAALDPELEKELRTLLAQWEAPPEAPTPETARQPVPEAASAEPLPTVPVAPQEVFQDVISEVETVITDLAAEETLLLEGAPGVPEAVKAEPIEEEVRRILRETVGGAEAPPEAPTVLMAKPAAGPAGAAEGTPFGPYVLLKRVATGGMAELFLAKKRGVEGFEKTLAIKRILPHLSDNQEFITMFIDEARLAARLTHPNIVQIFDMGRIDGDYYIAMEYVPGKDLRAVLRRAQEVQRPVPVEIAVIVAIHLCAALDYAHRARDDQGRPLHIVHRDVSPPNVLISYDGDIKLADFGVAKAAVKMHVTLSGALKGKVLYMAPEQANLQPVDARSDIYSLGLVLYEMLAGRNPFYDRGDTELTVLEKVRQGRVPPVQTFRPDVPEALARILEKALQPDPARRYESAREFQRDLEDFLVQRGIPNSTLYVARFIRELFPEEAGPIDDIREKLRHLPRIEPRTPPAAVEAPSEAAPTVLVETPVPAGVGVRSLEEVAYPTVTPKRRRPTALLLFLLAGLLVVVAGAITGIVLRQASIRSRPAAPVVPAPPPAASLEPTPPAVPAVRPETPAPETPTVAPAPPEAKAPAPPNPPAEAPETPPSPVKAPEGPPPTPPVKVPPRETARPAEKTPPEPAKTPPAETAPPSEAPVPPTPPVESPGVRPGDLVETPDEPPVPLKKVSPDLPALARAQRLSDTVVLRVLVDERGNVADVQVREYKYAILRDAAVEAARKYTFRPARHQGVPVKAWFELRFIFQP